MKKNYSIFLFLGIFSIILLGSGCATVEEPKYVPKQDIETRLQHAKKQRETLLRLLQHAQTVDDAANAKDHLAQVQSNIEALEAGKKTQRDIESGFNPTKERLVVWGPIGYVMWLTTWIVDKCYILYPWDWHVF